MEASPAFPKYRCHKEVRALKIAQVAPSDTRYGAVIFPVDPGFSPFEVTAEYCRKHSPVAGGYFVVYEDGYQSFSPAHAFESGYSRI